MAERETKITVHHISHIEKELFEHGFVGAKQFRILLIDLLDAGRIGHALRQPGDDGCHRIARHQARQDEIQQEGENKGN